MRFVWRKNEPHIFSFCVHQNQQCFAHDAAAAFVELVNHLAIQTHAQTVHAIGLPVGVADFGSLRANPRQVFDTGSPNAPALEEFAALQNRMFAPNADCRAAKFQKRLLLFVQIPVEPTEFVVLTVSVVVSVLSVAKFVATANHGHALRTQQRGDEVAFLFLTQLVNVGVVRLAFFATVPADVVIVAVTVVFTVGHVVLVVVAHQVV